MTLRSLNVNSGDWSSCMATRLKPDERRILLLEAAARVFGRRGFDATRMVDVAAEAGVAKGLLYRHFPSKDALFEALLERQGAEFVKALQGVAASAATDDRMDLLRRGFELWVDQVNSPEGRFNFADPGRHNAYSELRDRIRGEIAAVMDAADPSIDAKSNRMLAAAVQGAAESMVLVWAENPSDVTSSELVELLTRFCWQGLGGLQSALRSGETGG